MIPFADIGMMAWLNYRLQNIKCLTIWAPPETAKQKLAAHQQNVELKNDRGLPGAALFRTSTDKFMHSPPQATIGMPGGNTADGDYYRTQIVRVAATYSFVAWSRNLNEINNIERELWFLGETAMAHPVTGVVTCKDFEGNSVERDFKFPVTLDSGITYQRENDPKTGETVWYGLECNFKLTAPWVNSHINPQILQIDLNFQELLEDVWTLIKVVSIGDATP